MTTAQKLGPGDLAESIDNDFFLPRKTLAQLQLYAYQAALLPVGAEELYETIFGGQPEAQSGDNRSRFPIDNLKGLGDVFGDMAVHAQVWNQDIHPALLNIAHRISQYAVKSQQLYQGLIQSIRELRHDSGNSTLRRRIKRLADRLNADIDGNLTTMRATLENFRGFAKCTEQDRLSLEEERRTLQAQIDIQDSQLEDIDTLLADAENKLDAANKRYLAEATAAGTSPTYRVLGFLLLLPTMGASMVVADTATVIVSAVCTTEALKAKADIKAAMRKIEELNAEKLVELRLRAGLRLALRSGKEMATSAGVVEPALERAVHAWAQLAEDIVQLKSAVDDDPAKVPLMFRRTELKAAQAAWQKLGRAADEFRVYAYVRMLSDDTGDDAAEAESAEGDPAAMEEAGHA